MYTMKATGTLRVSAAGELAGLEPELVQHFRRTDRSSRNPILSRLHAHLLQGVSLGPAPADSCGRPRWQCEIHGEGQVQQQARRHAEKRQDERKDIRQRAQSIALGNL